MQNNNGEEVKMKGGNQKKGTDQTEIDCKTTYVCLGKQAWKAAGRREGSKLSTVGGVCVSQLERHHARR
jgi:hypothetical protein